MRCQGSDPALNVKITLCLFLEISPEAWEDSEGHGLYIEKKKIIVILIKKEGGNRMIKK